MVEPTGVKRKLAVILAADVEGYSRLMGVDEEATLKTLNAYREIIDGLIARHEGRIVGTAGDSVLAEFGSAVEAVRCAIAIQEELRVRNAELPDDRKMHFRIGVNLGDVMVEGDNLYGDGVNVAARLEGLAKPGGICISGDVYNQVRHKLSVGFEDIGRQEVKNIAKPVRVYSARLEGIDPGVTAPPDKALPLPDKPSIAVLPFTNMSGDPEQEYLADGLAEDLITALSKNRWFFVIARNSTFTYKGQAVEVKQVARELGVRYVLEGSVRKAGNRVRVAAQLIDATTGAHVWAENHDREIEDIFELQDEMTQTIVAVVEPELGAFERERAARKPPESLDAWETYQRALWHMWTFTRDGTVEALRLLQRAHELDPTFASVYAHEAYSHYLYLILGYAESPDESLAAGLAAAKKAIALDDKDPVAYFALGRVLMMQGEHDASIAELEMALRLNPNFAQAYHGLGFALALSGRLEEAVKCLEMAIRLSPRDPLTWGSTVVHSLTSTLMHDFEEAVRWARMAIREPRAKGYGPQATLAAALGNLGQLDEARAAVGKALEAKPDLSLSYLAKTLPTKKPGGLDPYLDGLRKAGLPEKSRSTVP